jgi:putative redox protein
MKISLVSETSVHLEPYPGQMLVEAPTPDTEYSPFHMLASGLGSCTHTVLHSWASNANLNADDLTVDVDWDFLEKPHRMGNIRVHINWPSLPVPRSEAAKRVAELCTIHATLMHPPTVEIAVERDEKK